jgi:hypothetical protein
MPERGSPITSEKPQMAADPLLLGERVWARPELIPWDAEAFGFPVGRLHLEGAAPKGEAKAIAASIQQWADLTKAAVIGVSVPADDIGWMDFLPQAGFTCVDLALTVSLSRLSNRPRTMRPAKLREAGAADHPGIVTIARTAFDFGRYHRDARFPRALADRRFARWIERSLANPRPDQKFYVSGPEGMPGGFMFLTLKNGEADWHLAGVSPSPQIRTPGPMLFSGMVDLMEATGVRSITSKISAANTAVLNIYAALGFRFLSPEYTFHWHASGVLNSAVPPHD